MGKIDLVRLGYVGFRFGPRWGGEKITAEMLRVWIAIIVKHVDISSVMSAEKRFQFNIILNLNLRVSELEWKFTESETLTDSWEWCYHSTSAKVPFS